MGFYLFEVPSVRRNWKVFGGSEGDGVGHTLVDMYME